MQGTAGETAQQAFLGLTERRRAKTIAVAAGRNCLARPTFDQDESSHHAAARRDPDPVLADPPVECRTVSQHRIDMAGDMRPVLGPNVTPTAEIIGRSIVSRTVPGVDRGQDVDRGGDLRAGGQE